jgi:DNA-binding winged helix-turn-helix (wHTH) protein
MRLQFADFTVDTGTRQLHRAGEELHLSPKAFDLLALLLAHRPAVVDKETLRDSLWPGTNVVETNLNNLVSEIRSALDDDPQQPRFVRTVHRVGFAFCGAAEDTASGVRSRQVAGDDTPRLWLLWNDRTIVLVEPDTVIGRDPKSAVWIDVPGVSRRHASIRLDTSGDRPTAEIEDLGSTNGTFVDGRRVRGAVGLQDGQTIRIGEATLTFRAWSSAGAATKRIRKVSATRRDR